ncbi:CapA family protein [Fodinicola feengrottensis]|uniref:CapA family protein n=1 Tax=Fodinicola feengrottensis TaxID=435914 RepID=A0ABN2HNC4_9ACTN|nr:CapA family protein [Fodinicola feengrottensis]
MSTLAAVLIAALTLAACSNGTASPPKQTVSPKVAAAASPSTDPGAPITISFAGDVHFTGRTAKLLDDPSTAFGSIATQFQSTDLALVNLETAVTTGGTPQPKQFAFRTPGTAFDALKAAGIDAAVMANNHALDYGQTGLAQTLAESRKRNYPVIGIGHNADEAWAPWIVNVRGTKIAFIAVSQLHELSDVWTATDTRAGEASAYVNLPRTIAAVKAARKEADVVIVYVHGGTEGQQCATPAQKTLAKQLSDAGADAYIETHAHLLLGDGWMGKTFVEYGLGNFLWWQDNALSNDTGVLKVTIKDKKVTGGQFTPAHITSTGQPVVATGSEATRITDKFDALHACTGLAPSPS